MTTNRAATLDERALRRWLLGRDLIAPDGRVYAWINPESPGEPYDEATALLARLYGWMGRFDLQHRLGAVLDELVGRQGWLGRDGIDYVFDTALALTSLRTPTPATARVVARLLAGRACEPVTREGWWSQMYGAHHIKCAIPLALLGRRKIAEAVADGLVADCFDGERFRIHAASARTYVHSHCYALEGLLVLGTHPEVLRAGADWMVSIQEPDGALPAWSLNVVVPGPRFPSDIVAQAVRIWAALDRDAYARPIERGLSRLAALQDRGTGGIAYAAAEGSADLNSWVGAFALQAARWAAEPPDPSELEWLV